MIACLASKCSRGCSLLGGLRNNAVSVQSTLQAPTSGTFFSQQQRTFIQMGSKLKVVDNSGAKVVKCIKGLGCCKKGARLGDKIVASVREAQPLEVKKGVARKIDAVKKGDVVYCVIVRAAMPKRRFDGSVVRFDDNAVVIINRGEPVGTRVAGPVCHELRKNRHAKILSLAKNVV